MFFIGLQPTARVEGHTPGPYGADSSLRGLDNNAHKPSLSDETVDAWIQRDDTPYGYPRGGGSPISIIRIICATTTTAMGEIVK